MKNLAIELRPQSLSEMLGMPEVISAIQKQLASERIPNVWLFEGEPGTGKTSLSYILAREVQGVYKGEIELIEINGGSETGIDTVRNLLPKLDYNPMYGNLRAIIVNEVQEMSKAAQTAWLVPLENPSTPNVVFLTTTDISKIDKALLDRCGAAKYRLKGLDEQGRFDLIYKAAIATESEKSFNVLSDLIEEYGITSGRTIVNMVEAYSNGVPLIDLVPMGEGDPAYFDIAKAVTKQNWPAVSSMLKKMKASDAKPLRVVVSGFLRNQLLTFGESHATIASDTLKKMTLYNAYESGLDLSALVAVLYDHCNKK